MLKRKVLFTLVFGLLTYSLSYGAVPVVEDGEAHAVVVIAQNPTKVAEYAAGELVEHVKISTGARLHITNESDIPSHHPVRIFVGQTEAAEKLGLIDDALQHDEFILRADGRDIYVLGKEDPFRDTLRGDDRKRSVLRGGDCFWALDKTSPNGTLHGVYELLHRYVGVRWLWPGELGTYVPELSELFIDSDLDERHKPKLGHRRFVYYHIRRASQREQDWPIEGLSYSKPVVSQYRDDLDAFLARHRLGYSEPKIRVGHFFAGWWTRYGDDHPEWFMLNEEGERGPAPGASGRHVAMCVSNEELHRFIVEEVWDGGDLIRLGEVDVRGFCQCQNCLDWDGPQPDDYPRSLVRDYEPRMVSDRYARFWKTIREMAAERNPDVIVSTFLYWNYLPAPLSDIQLNEYIYGEFVPWSGNIAFYPMPEEEDQWLREQWRGWVDRGIRIAYRPNLLHGAYVMPHLNTHQAGEFFQFAYENHMEGFVFDTLFGHWATRGPMLYMYMRLGWDPQADIDRIMEDYFSAYGPAAALVEEYFSFWEEHSRGLPGGGPGGTRYSIVQAQRDFPEEALAQGQSILNEALKAAEQHPSSQYADRVNFLMVGLEHARLSARFVSLAGRRHLSADDPQQVSEAVEALKSLVEFRRTHESLYFADLVYAARGENRRVDFEVLLQKEE